MDRPGTTCVPAQVIVMEISSSDHRMWIFWIQDDRWFVRMILSADQDVLGIQVQREQGINDEQKLHSGCSRR